MWCSEPPSILPGGVGAPRQCSRAEFSVAKGDFDRHLVGTGPHVSGGISVLSAGGAGAWCTHGCDNALVVRVYATEDTGDVASIRPPVSPYPGSLSYNINLETVSITNKRGLVNGLQC